MNLERFESELAAISTDHDLADFCQRTILHGTPYVFEGREDAFFSFKRRICAEFNLNPTEVFIVGSGKLGFSPHKRTEFSLDSDIDLAVVSHKLASDVDRLGRQFEYSLRASQNTLTVEQSAKYFRYLRYKAIGWMRPDLLPHKTPIIDFKNSWFEFFQSISYGQSEVGDYKVTAGLFHDLDHLEMYTNDSLRKVQRKLHVRTSK